MGDLQEQVQRAVDELVASGAERGVQVAVFRDGEQIVDAVAGLADPVEGRPVTPGTPFFNWSVLKGATSTLVHVLAERGVVSYDTRVAELWPEFAAHGKEGVTLRHVLTHTSGLPGIPPDTTPEKLCDWDGMCAALTDSEPWWEPGTRIGYHALSYGHILGEALRRATGRPVARLLREEIAEPLGVAGELYFGVPPAEQGRLARMEDAPGAAEALAAMPEDLPVFRVTPKAVFATAELSNRPDVLAADIPAAGKTSARAVARMYAALLGEVDGVRLLPQARVREATAVAATGTDEVFGMPSAWALGYAVGGLEGRTETRPGLFGMGGAGGTFACGDAATGTAFAVAKNRLTMDFATATRLSRLVLG